MATATGKIHQFFGPQMPKGADIGGKSSASAGRGRLTGPDSPTFSGIMIYSHESRVL